MAFNVEINESFLLHEQLFIKVMEKKNSLRESLVSSDDTRFMTACEEYFTDEKNLFDELRALNLRTFIYLYENCPADVLLAESQNAAMKALSFVSEKSYEARHYFFDKKDILEAYLKIQSDNPQARFAGDATLKFFKKQCGYNDERPTVVATFDRIEKTPLIDTPFVAYQMPNEELDYLVLNIPNPDFYETQEGMRYRKLELDQKKWVVNYHEEEEDPRMFSKGY